MALRAQLLGFGQQEAEQAPFPETDVPEEQAARSLALPRGNDFVVFPLIELRFRARRAPI